MKIESYNKQDNLKQKSLRFSFLDGIFACGMTGFTQEYMTPFLLLLGGAARHVGMLNAIPNFFASLVQLKSADITVAFKSRKRVIIISVFLQALMLLPMVSMALLKGSNPYIFIISVVLFVSFNAVSLPAWGSLMSDLVPEAKRGEYFGWRNKVLGFITVIVTFMAGFMLNQAKKFDIFYGFTALFGFAFIFRMVSWYFLTRMSEPSLKTKEEDRFTLINFLARIKESNFARFVLFIALMNFSVVFVSPFLAILMLNDLHFSYLLYTFITVTATATVYLTIRRWGLHADKVGNIKIIKFTSRIIGLIPLFWIISQKPAYLFFVQVMAGFVWSGFNLCASNFIYDAVTPEKRTRCISYFNVINGLALCSGALLGGFLLKKLPPFFGYKILTLCLISSILRILVAFSVPVRLKEVRPVEKISSNRLFFSMIGIKPLILVDRHNIRY